jgi:hypothetical protein
MPEPPGASETGSIASARQPHATGLGRLLLATALVLLAPASSAAPPAEGAAGLTEYQVKAAFLLNFARFVEWPASVLPAGTPIVFAVLGEDPFGAELEQTLSGQSVAGRPLSIKRSRRLEELPRAHVLFVSASEDEKLARILDQLAETPVLVVGETPDFALRGGIIGLRLEGGRVRFDVNIEAADRSGLRLSSQLLHLARIVRARAGETRP